MKWICEGFVSVNADTVGGVSGAGVSGASRQAGALKQTTRLSALGKVWREPADEASYEHLLPLVEDSHVIARLLQRRGFNSVDAARAFLSPDSYTPTSPMELPDVDKAIVRIVQAIIEKQHITVYGDYDVDGVTGTSVLFSVLKKLGASVDFYIPNRATEGYGLNLKAVSVLTSKHRTKLLITCDCGVSNFAEVNFAKSLGVDTLILDHHSMPELLPPAVGIVHPKRLPSDHPLFDLPGVGVAYKVCEALLLDQNRPEEIEPLLDFVTLGMIADLVPLVRENRYLVQIGLPKLINTPRAGLQALLKQVRKSEDTDIVGFGLAPRINAVGRLSEAKAAVELMTTDDQSVADSLARQLQLENEKRQELCEKIFREADAMVQSRVNLESDRAIAVWAEGWHHGVVGIVASRLVDKYHRPVFIGELETHEGVIRGSARGVDAMDLYQALKLNESLLTRWGGHKMAAGFSLESSKGDSFRHAIVSTCNKLLANSAPNPVLNIDLSISAEDVTQGLARHLTKLAPFGMGNKKPLLQTKELRCIETRELGKEGKHHRITLQSLTSEATFESVFWNSRNQIPAIDEIVHIAFTPEINSFNGRERLQLVLSDWRSGGPGAEPSSLVDFAEVQSAVNETAASFAPAAPPVETQAVNSQSASGLTFATRPLPSAPNGEPRRMDATAKSLEPSRDGVIDCNPESLDDYEARELIALESQSAQRLRDGAVAKFVVKDLRHYSDPHEALQRAASKLGQKVQIFSEAKIDLHGVEFRDRTAISPVEHLIFAQYPPSEKVMQSIIAQANPSFVYLVGRADGRQDEPAGFLRRLIGLVKYAVNQKEGQVEGEKLAALMSATKMSLALGLTVLRKVNLVDWFVEEGMLNLDLGEPEGNPEEQPEYKQLAASLEQAAEYRQWCEQADLTALQESFRALV
ncbi:MAG TPA: single-stranded-DNA-specific exonuclease RecJ [Oculatellaceae cyanobacterium]